MSGSWEKLSDVDAGGLKRGGQGRGRHWLYSNEPATQKSHRVRVFVESCGFCVRGVAEPSPNAVSRDLALSIRGVWRWVYEGGIGQMQSLILGDSTCILVLYVLKFLSWNDQGRGVVDKDILVNSRNTYLGSQYLY